MTAKELRKCLAKVPDDAEVCISFGKDAMPLYDIKSNEVFSCCGMFRLAGGNIYLNKSKKEIPYLDKYWLEKAHRYYKKGEKIITSLNDHKVHTITIIFSRWDEYLFGRKLRQHEWMTLVVDDMREEGGKLGVGKQWTICKVMMLSGEPI